MLCVVLYLGSSPVSAQTVVLVNGKATKVELNGANVTSVIGAADGYMTEYSNSRDDGFEHGALLTNGSQNPEKPEPAVSEPIVSSKVTIKAPIKSGNNLSFEKGSSTVSKEAVKSMRKKSLDIVAGLAKSILLETAYIPGDKKSQDISKARLEACKQILEKNGVGSNVIITNLRPSKQNSDKVSMTLR